MALTLQRRAFGDFTMFRLGTSDCYLDFIPQRSAYVHQAHFDGIDILWNYASPEALLTNKGHRNLALLPFPNRLLEGEYIWRDHQHKFEVNKPDTRSALHGFGPDANFELTRVDFKPHSATATLSYLHTRELHRDSYPFQVLFEVALSIDIVQKSFNWSLSATNLDDDTIPVGLGWHPYFLLPGGPGAWTLQMPPNQRVVLQKAIPTGALSSGLLPKQDLPIDTAWDDCFKLSSEAERTVKLQGPAYSLSLKQDLTTRYTQLYVPPVETSVAIEPMSCGVNAFQDLVPEVELAVGDTIATSMQITLHR